MRPLPIVLYVVAAFQAFFGAAFLLAPSGIADLLGLPPASPGWVHWLFAMMGARFLGYAYGLTVAARNPALARPWIDTMIVIQLVDWVATVIALQAGDVELSQATTAAFMPLVFVAALLWWHPRRAGEYASEQA